MAIILPVQVAPDDINTYDGLVAAIADTLKDSTLSVQAPRFIYLAESMFNRKLSNPEMEGKITAAAAEVMGLPTDFSSIKTVTIDTSPVTVLKYMEPVALHEKWGNNQSGIASNYTIEANQLVLAPAPLSTSTVTMTYFRNLTHLAADVQSNWLLENHPDLYLYASLMHAEFFGWNDERLPMIKAGVDEMISDIQATGRKQRTGGILTARHNYAGGI